LLQLSGVGISLENSLNASIFATRLANLDSSLNFEAKRYPAATAHLLLALL